MEKQPSLIAALWRFKWLIVGVAIVAAVAGYFISARMAAVYETEGLVLLTNPRTNATAGAELSSFGNPTRYLENQVAIMTSPIVTERAAQILGDGYTGEDLEEMISVESEANIDALTVRTQSNDRDEPIPITNAVVQAYGEVVSEEVINTAEATVDGLRVSQEALRTNLEDLSRQLTADPENAALQADVESTREALLDVSERINTITTNALLYGTGIQLYVGPQPPVDQVAPTPLRTAAIAFVLALLVACGYAFWRAERDQRADTKDAPAHILDAPLLAAVPEFGLAKAWAPAPTLTNPESAAAEAYHFALSSLTFVLSERNGTSVVITSAGPGDGKTITSLNLAIAAKKDGRDILLIDGDERMKGLTTLAGVSAEPSPNGKLGHRYQWSITATEDINFIAAGRNLGADISGYFRSVGFREAFAEATENRELVIVDAPPVMSASETAELAKDVDGVVLVVDEGTPLRFLQDAKNRLDLTGTPILGYIYNRADLAGSGYYSYGYAAPPSDAPAGKR